MITRSTTQYVCARCGKRQPGSKLVHSMHTAARLLPRFRGVRPAPEEARPMNLPVSLHCAECGEPIRLEDEAVPLIFNGQLQEAHAECITYLNDKPAAEDAGKPAKEKGSSEG